MTGETPRLTLISVSAGSKVERIELGEPGDPQYSHPADIRTVNVSPWTKAEGGWRWRTFGDELQLRSLKLPHVPVDLLRGEAIHLLRALEAALEVPRSRDYRLTVWQRVYFWWMRAVWNRKHHAMLDLQRKQLVKEFSERMKSRGAW